jgi:hypothetical protein
MPVISPAGTITMQTTITTGARAQLPSVAARSILLRAAKANTNTVWIGDSTVTTTGGGKVMLDLQPGEALFLDIGNANLLYSASAASQTLYVSSME